MNQMIVLELSTMHQIADESCIFGDGDVAGILHSLHRCKGMDIGAHTAGALDKMVSIPGVSAF